MHIIARVVDVETGNTMYTRPFTECSAAEAFRRAQDVPGETEVRFALADPELDELQAQL